MTSAAGSPSPAFVVQLSDPHVGAGADSRRSLEAAVAAVNRFPGQPLAVLVSGDIAPDGGEDYAFARETLDRLDAPFHVLPGNHDDRAEMRRAFGLPGSGAEPIQYALDLGPLRILVLDTHRPGSDAGELDPPRLAWLEAELARAPAQPTLIALHHPPLQLGIEAWDEIGLAVAEREELGRIVADHPQVRGLIAGHLHHATFGQLAGRPVLAAPSSYVQVKLDLGMTDLEIASEPPGFAVHTLAAGQLVSYIQPI